MVTTIGETEAARPYQKVAGASSYQPKGTQPGANGEAVNGSSAVPASESGSALVPPSSSSAQPSSSRLQSRRASNQSKELSDMELPDPSRLDEMLRPVQAANRSGGLLSADLDSSPLVSSTPSSPYLGSTTPGATSTTALPRFGNTEKQDELVEKLERLVLPDPEILSLGSAREQREKDRVAKELGELWDELDLLPEPEYIRRASLRASGAKTPEPTVQSPGEVVTNETALRRHSSVKRNNTAAAAA